MALPPSQHDLINKLIHHNNKNSESLLSIVVHFRESMRSVHDILIEFEATVHKWNDTDVHQCVRDALGSTKSAAITKRFYDKQSKARKEMEGAKISRFFIFMRILHATFLLRIILMSLDLLTDVAVLMGYWREWLKSEVSAIEGRTLASDLLSALKIFVPGSEEGSSCILPEMTRFQNSSVIPLTCYPRILTPRYKFLVTLVVLWLPTFFYMAEMIRSRYFSNWIDTKYPDHNLNVLQKILKVVVKIIINVSASLVWPIIAFSTQTLSRYKFQVSDTSKKAGSHLDNLKSADILGTRVHMIEVVTESSIQPLFQLYIVFFDLIYWMDSLHQIEPSREGEGLLSLIFQEKFFKKRQILSVLMSVLALSFGYTIQYRHNKDNAIKIGQLLVYFTSIIMFVMSRLLCFEIFAYHLGPGNFRYLLVLVSCHVLLMSLLHYVFSDSVLPCQRRKDQRFMEWIKQVFLVVHNCLLNGLANLYVHNNLEVFIQRPKNSSETSRVTNSDFQQRTLTRQFIFDVIVFVENAVMLFSGLGTVKQALGPNFHLPIVAMIVGLYMSALVLKILFYTICHPWAKLVRSRQRSFTSCILFGKQINCFLSKSGHEAGCGLCCISCSKDPEADKKRHGLLNPKRRTSFVLSSLHNLRSSRKC